MAFTRGSAFNAVYWLLMHTRVGKWYLHTKLRKHRTPHSVPMTMHVGIPADAPAQALTNALVHTCAFLEDNYAYVVIDKSSGSVAVVDPGDDVAATHTLLEVQAAWDAVHTRGPEAQAAGEAGHTRAHSGRGADRLPDAHAAGTAQMPGRRAGDGATVGSGVESRSGGGFTESGGTGHGQEQTLRVAMQSVQNRPRLTHILVTHYHFDHAGGVATLAQMHPFVSVCAPIRERAGMLTDEAVLGPYLPAHSHSGRRRALADDEGAVPSLEGPTLVRVDDGDIVRVGELTFACVHTPAHTRGHMVYVLMGPGEDARPAAVFSGDTLFVAGVGKFFEGSAADMCNVLFNGMSVRARDRTHTLLRPGDSALLFPGHEYTVDNLFFAKWLEPDNPAIAAKLQWATSRRGARQPTVGSLASAEATYNPFLRVREPAVQRAIAAVMPDVDTRDACACTAAVRKLKDKKAHRKSATARR